jgi:hypothetical protein
MLGSEIAVVSGLPAASRTEIGFMIEKTGLES